LEADSRTPSGERAVNDHVYDALWGVNADEGAFLCECGSSPCAEVVQMTSAEYVRLRDRGELVFAPGHGETNASPPAYAAGGNAVLQSPGGPPPG
jgi:hypothetical protein